MLHELRDRRKRTTFKPDELATTFVTLMQFVVGGENRLPSSVATGDKRSAEGGLLGVRAPIDFDVAPSR